MLNPQGDHLPEDNSTNAYAHTRPGQPPESWEPLRDHLVQVGHRAERFAGVFGSAAWGRLAGLWHDLGKYRPEFQRRLAGSGEQVEHAGLGAALAAEKDRTALPLVFVIAGHHAGLANRDAQRDSGLTALTQRIARNKAVLDTARDIIPADLLSLAIPPIPQYLGTPADTPGATARRWEFWTRFLFSSLVDADRLATEAFCDPPKADDRRAPYADISQLRARLEQRLSAFPDDTEVNRLRGRVLEDCHIAAERESGLFSLTAPTGSGKTLSAMAFALGHAEQHRLHRVIVVVPYTTIIEQNAGVYREALGGENVIEHHASIDEKAREEEYLEQEVRRRLATENWDAPIIVTTTVQFFESLLSNHPSQCRKLHNIAGSVIILDEAQSLPPGYLSCLLDVMRELVRGYRCSIVISTATQPALGRRDSLPEGLDNVREIIRQPAELSRALSRVHVRWPQDSPVPYLVLATELAQHKQVLAVVHLRKDARQLADGLPEQGRYHLSALMCPAHRIKVLDRVRKALVAGEPCRLVATQLIEAGVDVDFPVVYRALAGLDSLAQAAGRCNREGKQSQGTFVVFRAETKPPPGVLRKGLEATEAMLKRHGKALNLTDADYFDEYFRMLYHASDRDLRGVQVEREQFNFATVDHLVALVEDGYRRAIVVLWGDAEQRVARHRAAESRQTLRALQPYIVQVPERDLATLASIGAVDQINDSLSVLTTPFRHLYDGSLGLTVADDAIGDPAAHIV